MEKYIPALIMFVATIVGSVYALVRGGAPERWGAGIYVVNWILSNIALYVSARHHQVTEPWLMAIDIVYFLSMIWLSLRAQRYWPMWVAALLLDTVLTHFLMFASGTAPFSYSLALWVWGVPIPVLIGIGAWRHRKRVKTRGDDPAWT